MTELERRGCLALARATFPVASWWKRLARNLLAQANAAEPTITDRQAAALWSTLHRFRRQIPDIDLRIHAAEFLLKNLSPPGAEPHHARACPVPAPSAPG